MNFSAWSLRIDLILPRVASYLFSFADSCAFLSQQLWTEFESQFRFWYLVCCLIGRKLKNKQAAPKANTTRWRLPGQQRQHHRPSEQQPPLLGGKLHPTHKQRPTGCLEFNFHFPSPIRKKSVNFILEIDFQVVCYFRTSLRKNSSCRKLYNRLAGLSICLELIKTHRQCPPIGSSRRRRNHQQLAN